MKFIDKVIIEVRAGSGGAGHCSFRREKYVPKGGPDGGNGGNGGNVTLVADSHLTTLLDFHYRRHFHAQNGAAGEKSRKTGRSGNDLTVRVPVGTVVRDSGTKRLLGDLTTDGQTLTIARGGIGGRGNAEFKTSVNQAPRYAEPGRPGEELMAELELKIIADVGLVGFPNAGKSTLISVISAAKPKIADYPFTTLTPNIGIARVGDEQSFSVADIPGLIEGAHRGKGLGIKFLRHVERTRLLVFLIDAASDDIERDYEILCNELAKYRGSLDRKRKIIAISKTDTIDAQTRRKLENITFGEDKLVPMFLSSVVGEGVEAVKWAMWNTLQTVEETFDDFNDEDFDGGDEDFDGGDEDFDGEEEQ
ncbi:MAG: GTPase ObgE [Bacteroidetes bacterium]|nr:GTPase ObgE [Bacteroidota bacterium]